MKLFQDKNQKAKVYKELTEQNASKKVWKQAIS